MNELDPEFRPIRTLNPVPRKEELPYGSVTTDALLASIDDLASATATPMSKPALSPRTRRGWLVAAAAAVVVLVVMTPLLLFVGGTEPDVGGTEPDVAETVAPTTAVQVATPPAVEGWSRIPHDDSGLGGPGSGSMASVTVGGPGFVAVGDDDGDAAVWTSVDGIDWSRTPDEENIFGGLGSQWMLSVTVGGPGFVAVGDDEGDAAVWTSVDGITWSRVAHDETAFGGASMSSVTEGGPGLVAVGLDGSPDGDRDAAVWTSIDGIVWSRVIHDETVFGGIANQMMNDVTVGGPGLVAVGYDGTSGWDNPSGVAAVWTSVDGITWSRVPHDDAVFGPRNKAMLSVTSGGPGLVAVGYSPFGCRPVWTSVDGITWSRTPNDVPGACNRAMREVTVGGPGLVAVGHGAASWTSVDGINWIQVYKEAPGNSLSWMTGVTAGEFGLVAVGRAESDSGQHEADAAVWLWTD